jgi:subtilisin-like proprotein convertase family protein
MLFTSLTLGLAVAAPQAQTPAAKQEILQVAEQVLQLKASAPGSPELEAALERYQDLSAELGGDDPLITAGAPRGPRDSQVPGVLNAVTTLPPGVTVNTTGSFPSAPALAIVDNTIITDTVIVSGQGTNLWDVDLTVDINHTWAADLDIYLISPAGTRITVTTDNGGGNDDVFTGSLFDESAVDNALNYPYVDLTTATTLAPEGHFHFLAGEDPNGTWTLEVGDDATIDTGIWNSWSLDITTVNGTAPGVSSASMSNTTPIAILDNTTASDTMSFSGLAPSIAEVRLYTEITHTWAGDLILDLVAPSGNSLNIVYRMGGSNDDVWNGTTFADITPSLGGVPSSEDLASDYLYTSGVAVPDLAGVDLSRRLGGEDPNGTWTLFVTDGAGGDTGSLNRWDLVIDTYGAPPPPVSYCTAGTTQSGCNATMGSSGTPSLSNAGPFTLTTTNVEGTSNGILFYGITGRNASTWGIGGSSYLCVKAPTQRTPVQNSGGTNGSCNGSFSLDWNGYVAANPLKAIHQALVVGSVVDGQAWFRDPGSVKNTSLSDGLEWVVAP